MSLRDALQGLGVGGVQTNLAAATAWRAFKVK
jgi:hypothetical protein